MKDHVSLEVAQKLQKAGWKGETQYWYNVALGIEDKDNQTLLTDEKIEDGFYDVWYPAPTATQLAEELPTTLDNRYNDCTLWMNIRKTNGASGPNTDRQFHCWYENARVEEQIIKSAPTLSDALGLMMEYLLVNKLIP